MTFEDKLNIVLDEIRSTLLSKNEKYGNAVLEPVRIFSKASPIEQLKVRIDDKLSRISTGTVDIEDTVLDLVGYLVLLKMTDITEQEVGSDCENLIKIVDQHLKNNYLDKYWDVLCCSTNGHIMLQSKTDIGNTEIFKDLEEFERFLMIERRRFPNLNQHTDGER